MPFTLALLIAVSYWGARDVHVPCHPQYIRTTSAQMLAWQAGDGVQALMRTNPSRCIIYGGQAAAIAHQVIPDVYCSGIVHEVGHIAGLEHSYGGVMSATGRNHRPWACEHPREWLRRHLVLSRRGVA